MPTMTLMSETLATLVEQGALPPLQSAKLQSTPRPLCQEGVSLTKWRIFKHNGCLYKQSTHMYSCQECALLAMLLPGVSKSLISQGMSISDSVDGLFAAIEKLCVQGHNLVVERLKCFSLKQQAGEKFIKYLARLLGQADLADFSL